MYAIRSYYDPLDQHQSAISLFNDEGEIFRAIIDRKGNRHQSEAEGREIESDPVQTVTQHDRHPVSGLKVLLAQSGLPAPGQA